MILALRLAAVVVTFAACALAQVAETTTGDREGRPRAREAGVIVGVLPPGPLNAITDVAGVLVGHTTIVRGSDIRTGVTAILPHAGNLFQEKVPAAIFVGNGFGKLMGYTQVEELGEIETPILLTSTLAVPRVADFLLDYMLARPGNQTVQSINPIVGETNDGYLNDIRGRHFTRNDTFSALDNARSGAVEEGSVGAGTGTVAFGWKGGIGTASRRLPANLGGYTVGVLVQTNFGGVLTMAGAPVGKELGQYYLKQELGCGDCRPSSSARTRGALTVGAGDADAGADGSVMIVIATDAPADARNLRRVAARAIMGLARTGAVGANGSGDYAIAFSTAPELRIRAGQSPGQTAGRPGVRPNLSNEDMSPLFLAAIEATEEAVYNSLFRAVTTTGRGHTVEALPLEPTLQILREHNVIAK
jgi:D-aminopeptidase